MTCIPCTLDHDHVAVTNIKSHRKVRFGYTTVKKYITDGTLYVESKWQTEPCTNPKPSYIDVTWFLKARESAKKAISRAFYWAVALGYQGNAKYQDSSREETPQIVDKTETSDSESDCAPAINTRRKWIADSGSGHDLISERYLGGDINRQEGKKIKFLTAGGTTASTEFVEVKIGKLEEVAKPIVLEHTPPVLSIGKRVMEQGYTFHWPPKANPYFIHPRTGKKIKLKVIDNVPYLIEPRSDDCSTDDCAPAPEETSSGSDSRNRGVESIVEDSSVSQDDRKERYRITTENVHEMSDGTKNQVRIATSLSHLMTHFPKNAHCPACDRAKLRKIPSFSSHEGKSKKSKEFGGHVTADLKTLYQDKKSWGIDGQKCILVIYDCATEFVSAYPLQEKTAEKVLECFLDFQGNQKIKYIYCDGGPELISAARKLPCRYDTSAPYSPKRNAIAEEKIKRVLYSSRTLLEHSGMPPFYWPYSVRAACMGMNIVGGRRSPYFLRHGIEFQGQFIPFGCIVDYLPTSKDAERATPVFGPRAIPGIFLCYHENSGGTWGHSHKQGEYHIARFSDLQTNPLKKPSRVRVGSIVFDKSKIEFPMKEGYERRKRTMLINEAEKKFIEDQNKDSEETGKIDDKGKIIEDSKIDPEQIHSEQRDSLYADMQTTNINPGTMRIEPEQVYKDKQVDHPSILPQSGTEKGLPPPHKPEGNLSATDNRSKGDGQQPKAEIPKRFIQDPNNKDNPLVYGKNGELLHGEWVGGKFVKYKQNTPRIEGLTPEDWRIVRQSYQSTDKPKRKSKDKPSQKSEGRFASPAMPVIKLDKAVHRDKIAENDPKDAEWFAACVAKSIGKREALANPAAKASLDKEWNKLRAQGC
jgi:hypothetical protein